MAEAKDPAIKLFGKTIPLQDSPPPPAAAVTATTSSPIYDVTIDEQSSSQNNDNKDKIINNNTDKYNDLNDDMLEEKEEIVITQARDTDNNKDDQEDHPCHMRLTGIIPQNSGKSTSEEQTLGTPNNLEVLSDEKSAVEPSKTDHEKTETSISPEKTLKKPDKIIPCPRCNSMDTKFCYYNNYNVNQPRHFCKKCQRYWTAGGTMRNVPIGAGRRKNKSSASHYRHITVPEALQNGIHPGLQSNGTVLTFGSDGPLCESMASILNLAEKTTRISAPNVCQKPEDLEIPMPFVAMETGGSHLEESNSKDDSIISAPKETASPSCLPFPPQISCYPGTPWPYSWNSAQWSPPVPAPPFYPNGLALPFYPAPGYWGCTVPGAWSIPLIAQPSPPSQLSPTSGPNSPTLGKHSRDGNVLTSNGSEEKEKEDTKCERSLWIPKTLRIDDPGEAAKSSIWTTLGIKNNDKPESIGRGSGLFKAFNSKCSAKDPNKETSTVLEANPAALSRSQTFQENS